MKTRWSYLVAAAITIALCGCAASRNRQAGDDALAHDRPEAAATYYQRALSADPGLERDQGFLKNLAAARARASMNRGKMLEQQHLYLEAIAQYDQAASIDPDLTAAAQASADAHRHGGDYLLQLADTQADADELDQAATQLKQAAQLDPANPGLAQAQESLASPASAAGNHRDLYDRAIAAADQKRWQDALEAWHGLVAVDPHHLTARAQAARAQAAMAQSNNMIRAAQAMLKTRDLGGTVALLDKAADLWPGNPEMKPLRDQIERDRQAAGVALAEARTAVDASRWDDALAAIARARALQADLPAADPVESSARQAAAAASDAQGADLFAKARLADADAAFARSLGYLPDNPAARRGRAKIAMARADAAVAAGQVGLAWLYHQIASQLGPRHEFGKPMAQDLQRLAVRIDTSLAVMVSDPRGSGKPSPDGDAMAREIAEQLGRRKPDYLTIVPSDDPAHRAGYAVTATLVSVNIGQRLMHEADRVYTYAAAQPVANPEVVRLEGLIRQTENDLTLLQTRPLQRHTYVEGGVVRFDYQPAPLSAAALAAIHDLETRLAGLQESKAKQPLTVTGSVEMQWPYKEALYRKTGHLAMRIDLRNLATGKAEPAIAITSDFTQEDTQITHGNSSVGLDEHMVDLPSDTEARDLLMTDAAEKAARAILPALSRARAAEFGELARQELARGNAAGAADAQALAAYVLAVADPVAAAGQIQALKGQLRVQPAVSPATNPATAPAGKPE